MTRPNIPRNSAMEAATLIAELRIVVVTPTDSIREDTRSAGSESVRMRDTTFLTVRRAKARMMRVQARKDPVIFVTRYA